MIVVSDTSPLNYLILTDLDHLLPRLFGRIVIPQAVIDELISLRAPQKVKSWVDALPGWLEVLAALAIDPALSHLGPGEREAICLAERLGADLVLLDEAKAREVARQRGIAVVGTLAILDRAAAQGIVDLREALERLQRTTFRASPRVLATLKRR